VDRLRIGRSIRVIRIRQGWRQLDLAVAAGVSRQFISNAERGVIRHSDLERLEHVCQALGAELDVRVRWRGEGLDLLLDEAHADLVERIVALLHAERWETALEVTFNEYGERGSIDILAWHRATKTLLVVEVKSVVADAQATLMPLDRKARLAPKVGQRLGWESRAVSRLLVVWDLSVNRRRLERLEAMFATAFPLRGRSVRRWLRRPEGSVSALLFVANATRGGTTRRATGRLRVRRPERAPSVR
jgi:transcriptional regulator with XRE-family HTH domain